MASFDGKTALVFGGTEGIGRAIAQSLVEAGANVVAGSRSQDKLDALQADLGDSCVTKQTDVCSEQDVEAMVETAVSRFGRIDAAFNVAGQSFRGNILDLKEEDLQSTLDICLKGVMFGMKHAARQMVAQGDGGAIVNISSVNSFMPLYGAGAYAASKAAVDMLTKNAALEMARDNIRVNSLLPGLTATDMTKRMREHPDLSKDFEACIAMGRAADATEIAEPALFLASKAASYITGTTLVVDGGWALTTYPDMSRFY